MSFVIGDLAPVRQSASKEDFLKALRLDTDIEEDRSRFAAMWEEVTRYWVQHFEVEERHILREEYASNMAVQRPYKWAHLCPNFVDESIKAIWKDGGKWPRYYYDQGQSDDPRVYNWVLKWLFWHVCRYRDWRNRKNRSTSSTPTAVSLEVPPIEPPGHDYWQTIMDGRPQ